MIKCFKLTCVRVFLIFIGIPLTSITNISAQTVRQIEIINADIVKADKKLGPGSQKLIGNVNLKHDNALMYCDSAYFYSRTHSLDAFSNVRIEQGDTLFLYGDKLHYEGETRIAKVRNHVKLVDDSTVLRTDYLDYNRETEIAYYLNGGVINEGKNELTSGQGYYYTKTKIFHFKDSVVIINPDYTIYSDTMKYNTKTKITYFFGPTQIIGEDNYLYCESGWYDTNLDISLMDKNAFLRSEGRTLNGDTLYYERKNGFGEAKSNVVLFDSSQNVYLKGNYGVYYESDQRATITDSALMIQIQDNDSLFVHADTLRSIADTSSIDSKILLAYNHVKFFRNDIQGMCDSLEYIEKDSTFHLFTEPIIWAEDNQITATKMELVNKNGQLYRIYLRNIALLIQKVDTAKFNQIRGKSMVGYFINNKLVQLDVTGNGQSVYYPIDQGEIIGVNRSECSDLIIYLKDNKISKVNYKVKPEGKYYPLDMFPENQHYLDGFSWNSNWRPMKSTDVFYWK